MQRGASHRTQGSQENALYNSRGELRDAEEENIFRTMKKMKKGPRVLESLFKEKSNSINSLNVKTFSVYEIKNSCL